MLQEPRGLSDKIRSYSKKSFLLEQKNSLLDKKHGELQLAPVFPKIPYSTQKGIIKSKDFSGNRITEERALPNNGNGRTEKQIVEVVDYYVLPDTYTVGGNSTNSGYVYGTKFIEQ